MSGHSGIERNESVDSTHIGKLGKEEGLFFNIVESSRRLPGLYFWGLSKPGVDRIHRKGNLYNS